MARRHATCALVVASAWAWCASARGGEPAPWWTSPGKLRSYGIVDVTAPPFGADPTGRRDSTQAIQRAIRFARDHAMVTFFPPGTYAISDTLKCCQGGDTGSMRTADPEALAMGLGANTRMLPCILVGSRRAKARPVLLLSPNSPGFVDPDHPKYVVHFWRRGRRRQGQPDRPFAPNGS
ncbi:glycosyl hydrolase family 28-related protein, partial [Planctomycetota bacterium]